AKGMAPEEARRRARLDLGSVEKVKEESRDARSVNWIQDFVQDLHYGVRAVRKSSGFASVAILTLGLGIGASTSVFSVINAVLIRALPYPHPDRLVYVWSPNPRFQLPIEYLTPMNADFFDLQMQNHSFTSLALFGVAKFNVAVDGRSDALSGARVTGSFFETMGVGPELGRTVNQEDDQQGRERVAVISHSLWRERFGAQREVLGKTLLLDAKPYRIIGVMPAGFAFPRATDVMSTAKVTDLWIPWAMPPEQRANREDSAGDTIGRLRPDVSLEQAQAEMSALMASIDLLRPPKDRGFGAQVQPLFDSVCAQPERIGREHLAELRRDTHLHVRRQVVHHVGRDRDAVGFEEIVPPDPPRHGERRPLLGDLQLHTSCHQQQAAAPVEVRPQPSELGVGERVGRPGDGDDPHARGDRRVGHSERADIVMAAEPLAQRIEAALAARRDRVGDLAEGDDRLLGVGQRPDVGRKPVLEIVGLLQERHGPHPVGVTHGEPQVPFLYLELG